MTRNHLTADVFAALKGALLAQLNARAAVMPPDQKSCLFCVHVIFNVNGAHPHPPVALVVSSTCAFR